MRAVRPALGESARPRRTDPKDAPTIRSPHGIQAEDVVEGNVTDADAVRSAVEGCDAVIHAAAIFSLDPRRAEEMGRTNVAAAENVLGAAVAADCTSIVHVSNTVALVRHGGTDGELPLGDVDLPDSRSKSVTPRPFDDSIRDTIGWLVDAGHLPEKYRSRESTTINM